MFEFLNKIKARSIKKVEYEHVVKLEAQCEYLQEYMFSMYTDMAKLKNSIDGLGAKHAEEPLPPSPQPKFERTVEPVIPADPLEVYKKIKPSQIVHDLDLTVIGQDSAKKALAVTMCNHLHSITNTSDVKIDKNNLLFMGPSGSGKTFLIKTLADILKLPFLAVDATEFSATGYQGKDVHRILDSLVMNNQGSIEASERAIVFIDEIDKIANSSSGKNEQFDKAVQYTLLKMVEGEKYIISTGQFIDTSKILFIFGGAFEGLFKERETVVKQTIGFSTSVVADDNEPKVSAQDELMKFGLIKEFVGRLGQVIELNTLDDEAMKRIITEPKNSIVSQYNQLFKNQEIDDYVTIDDVSEILAKSKELSYGARGLKTIAAEHFRDRFYR